jgi:Tol biopolymer transport system component
MGVDRIAVLPLEPIAGGVMSEPPRLADGPPDSAADRLDSWKEIAAYLKRDVSTVQRWEKREGMPVHRHVHDRLGSVYAFRTELDAWWLSRNPRLDADDSPVAISPASEHLTSARPLASGEPAADRANVVRLESDVPTGAASTAPRRRLHLLWWTLAAVAVFLVASLLWFLERADSFWQNPISDARFQQLTDFEGTEQAAAISRDGRFVAFLGDRAGPMDVWVTHVGTGLFHNLTRGNIRELDNPDVRTIGFSPDATLVSMWIRRSSTTNPADISVWAVPTLGGEPRPYFEGVAEFDWSADGGRLVYHTPGPGDPLFVKDRAGQPERKVWVAPAGFHGHFPVWSPDGTFIYFVYGALPDRLDIWRIAPTGGSPERITFHDSRVTHPVFLNRRTLLYLATTADGAGPWLYGLDVERRKPHRLSFGMERYTSLAASADRRRLAVTVANQTGTLWRAAITEGSAEKPAASRITLPTTRGRSPRYGRNYLLYVSARGDSEGLWKLADETATEVWSSAGARVIGGPAIAPDGWHVAFSAEERGRTRLYVMNADGSALRPLSESLEPRGAPAWAPDGRSIAVPITVDGEPRLVSVSVDGQTVAPLVSEYSVDPAWSPDGEWLLYSGPDVGTTFQVRAVRADGRPHQFKALTLSRGARRVAFLRGRRALIVLRGEIKQKNFSLIDLETGTERPLMNFARGFIIGDFDISPDGREIVFDQVQENSDIVLIDLK